jgi:hypothetical protein
MYSILTNVASSALTSALTRTVSSITFPQEQKPDKDLWKEVLSKDVESSTRSIENFIKELNYKGNHEETIRAQIVSIYCLCKQVLSDYSYVQSKLVYNNSLYLLKSFRKYNVRSTLENILINFSALEQKFKLLKDFISFNL